MTTALEVRVCTCRVARTRNCSCRSITQIHTQFTDSLLRWDPTAPVYLWCWGVITLQQSELNLERDKHDLEEGILSSCSSKRQRAMKLGLALNGSRKTADSSDVVTPQLVLELQEELGAWKTMHTIPPQANLHYSLIYNHEFNIPYTHQPRFGQERMMTSFINRPKFRSS